MLKEKNKVGGLVLSGFKTDCETMIIKTVWNWQKNREIDSRKKNSPEIGSHKYS